MEQVLSFANSGIMWLFAFIIIGAAITMILLVWKKANVFVEKTNVMTLEEKKIALKTGSIVAIGPSLSVFIVAIGMIAQLGAPVTLMRVGVIGSAATELMAAGIGASTYGADLGTAGYNLEAFTTSIWTMAFMSMGYLIFVPVMTRTFTKASNKLEQGSGKGKKFFMILGIVVPILVIVMFALGQMTTSSGHAAALIFSAILMVVLNYASKKFSMLWLRQWAMGFCVLGGLVAGSILG